jgi:hypothetical protein
LCCSCAASLAESKDGCACFVAEGCCGLLVDALKNTKNDHQLRANLLHTIGLLAKSEEFVAEFVAAGGCAAFAEAFNISQADLAARLRERACICAMA